MTLRVLLIVVCSLLSSCFLRPYRIDVQQGNYIDSQLVAALKPGMTRGQVRYLLGTPLLADTFNPNRWDYLFIDWKGHNLKEARRLTLYFENDRLVRALTDLPPASPESQPQKQPAAQSAEASAK